MLVGDGADFAARTDDALRPVCGDEVPAGAVRLAGAFPELVLVLVRRARDAGRAIGVDVVSLSTVATTAASPSVRVRKGTVWAHLARPVCRLEAPGFADDYFLARVVHALITCWARNARRAVRSNVGLTVRAAITHPSRRIAKPAAWADSAGRFV